MVGAQDELRQRDCGFTSHRNDTHTNLESEMLQCLTNHEEDDVIYSDRNFVETKMVVKVMLGTDCTILARSGIHGASGGFENDQ